MAENLEQNKNAADLKVEGSGKTLADAEEDAMARLEELAGTFDIADVQLVVLDEGSKGFLGMGSNQARVEVRLPGRFKAAEVSPDEEKGTAGEQAVEPGEALDEAPAPDVGAGPPEGAAADLARERLAQYMEKIISSFGLEGSVDISEDDESLVGNVNGSDLGIFIGRHGQTIDAVQYLANVIVYRGLEGRKRVIVDAEDYRERRAEVLQSLAERGVSEIKKGKPDFELKPMSAAERRIIHLYLQDREGVETVSEGRDPFRRVIIVRADD